MPLSPHAYTSTLARATVMLALVVTAAAVGVAALPAWRRGLLPFGTQYPGSNLLAKTYPNEITARYNSSVWILPAPKAAVAALLPAGQKLLSSHPVPGLAADEWPLVIQSGLDSEIRQYGLTVGDFYITRTSVPWMDKSGDGVTPFTFHYNQVISLSVLPVLGTLTSGDHPIVGKYNPDYFAFRDLGNGRFGQDATKLGGEQLFSIRYSNTPAAQRKYTLDLFKDFTNQGYANYAANCVYHATTYDLPLTNPTFVKGNVTLGTELVPAPLAKKYTNVQGLRAAEHFIETLSQPCAGRASFPPVAKQ